MDWIENNQLPSSIIDESHFANEVAIFLTLEKNL
jgi:hypothetical protein